MVYSKADMFFDNQNLQTATSEVLDNNYNRNWEGKAYLVVHANTTQRVSVTLLTGNTKESVTTTVNTWSAVPNKDGYVVMDKLPRGIGRYMKLQVSVTNETAKVLAGIVLEEDLDYDWTDRDPKAVFDGEKTEVELRDEIA